MQIDVWKIGVMMGPVDGSGDRPVWITRVESDHRGGLDMLRPEFRTVRITWLFA